MARLTAALHGWQPAQSAAIYTCSMVETQLTLFLAGDVMTGRGIDRIMPHPGNPTLYESVVRHADTYIELAERQYGPIHRPAAPAYIWGAALAEIERAAPVARIVNLETAITASDTPWPFKGINYRMHPANIACLSAAAIDCCALANNHLIDWERQGMSDTIAALDGAGITHAGAGATIAEASAPAIIPHAGGRILVYSLAATSSGVPPEWAATDNESGVQLLPDMGVETARQLGSQWQAMRQPDDIIIASIHWGGNWGYAIDEEMRIFAHALIDEAGADLVHGHSSHHPRPLECYRGKLILYGCGDLINDYEGIEGFDEFHPDLALLYFPQLAPDGTLRSLAMRPLRRQRFTLQQASKAEAAWLTATLGDACRRFGCRLILDADNTLRLL